MLDYRVRSFRPKLANFVPGIGSIIEGCYWFDGVEVQVQLLIRMSPGATYPMGTNPAIFTPSQIAWFSSALALLPAGAGSAHDAMAGKVHALVATLRDAASVGLYVDGAPYGGVTGASPIVWGANSILRVRFGYRPLNPAAPKNFAAFGDSITRFETNGGDTASWTHQVPVEGLTFAGGYAKDGGTSTQVLAGAGRLDADAAVCLVGVNDIYQQATYGTLPLATTLANIEALEAKVNADNFLLCKLAPYDLHPGPTATMNLALAALAADRGWPLLDPFGAYRTAAGTWSPGASYDGVHPNAPAQASAAALIRAAILAL